MLTNSKDNEEIVDSSEFIAFDEENEFSKSELEVLRFLNKAICIMVNKRKSLNMTQQELADKVGISKISMCRIETRAKRPSLETLYKIASSLGIEINFIEA